MFCHFTFHIHAQSSHTDLFLPSLTLVLLTKPMGHTLPSQHAIAADFEQRTSIFRGLISKMSTKQLVNSQ